MMFEWCRSGVKLVKGFCRSRVGVVLEWCRGCRSGV